jgi:hypothetical protein
MSIIARSPERRERCWRVAARVRRTLEKQAMPDAVESVFLRRDIVTHHDLLRDLARNHNSLHCKILIT